MKPMSSGTISGTINLHELYTVPYDEFVVIVDDSDDAGQNTDGKYTLGVRIFDTTLVLHCDMEVLTFPTVEQAKIGRKFIESMVGMTTIKPTAELH